MIPSEIQSWQGQTLPFEENLLDALQQQHHAAQFIALAGRYLIPQEADDSNTNMQYHPDREWLVGNELSARMRIVLQLPDIMLSIIDENKNIRREIQLEDKTKKQVFELLKHDLADLNMDVSKFINELHYEVPEHDLDKETAFSIRDKKYFQEVTYYRHNAEIIINKITGNFKNADPVRVWPHHFDTGSYIPLEKNSNGVVSKSIGLGWAIPDGMVDEPYYYLSFWSEDPVEGFNKLPAPETGEWIKTGWNGGVVKHSDILKLTTSSLQKEFVETFFRSGIRLLTEHYVR